MDKPGIVSERIRPLETTLELSVWWLLSKQITCSELSALLLQHCTLAFKHSYLWSPALVKPNCDY